MLSFCLRIVYFDINIITHARYFQKMILQWHFFFLTKTDPVWVRNFVRYFRWITFEFLLYYSLFKVYAFVLHNNYHTYLIRNTRRLWMVSLCYYSKPNIVHAFVVKCANSVRTRDNGGGWYYVTTRAYSYIDLAARGN